MEHRIDARIDQRAKAKDWKPGVIIGGILAIAGMLITAAAVYQLQVTGDERRALSQSARSVAKPALPAPTPEQLQAREELARLQLERDLARAAAWRARVDAESGPDQVRCYSGTRLVKRDGAWTDAGRC
ncbi:hypothetical protein [Luteimonas sp. TWI1437]|uniref:hypothetical protein n=1 Tax=unclassified Luteimonas TaxID=2629088 RepID=UPI003208F5E9